MTDNVLQPLQEPGGSTLAVILAAALASVFAVLAVLSPGPAGSAAHAQQVCASGPIEITEQQIAFLIDVREAEITICRDGSDLTMGAIIDVSAAGANEEGTPCEFLITWAFSGTGTVPESDEAPWASQGELLVTGDDPAETCPDSPTTEVPAGVAAEIEGTTMSGFVNAAPWRIDDASALLDADAPGDGDQDDEPAETGQTKGEEDDDMSVIWIGMVSLIAGLLLVALLFYLFVLR